MNLLNSSFAAAETRRLVLKDKADNVIYDADGKECYAMCYAYNGPKGEEHQRKYPNRNKKEENPDVARKKAASSAAFFIDEIYLVDPVSKEVIIEGHPTHDEKTALLTPKFMTFLLVQINEFVLDDENF